MVKKLQKTVADKKTGAQLSSTVKDSAQQIWLAGLGAFAKAQEEGGKVFDALVKEGLSIQRKTQSVAEEKITEATSKMATMATDITTKASGQWDKLENIFEDRVAKALHKLGVPSAKDVAGLTARVDELTKKISGANAKNTSAKTSSVETTKPKRPAAKKVKSSTQKPAPTLPEASASMTKPARAKRAPAKKVAP